MIPADLFPGLSAWDPAPLRNRLRKCGFHLESLDALGLPEHWLRSEISRVALLGHVPEGTLIDSLIRLFTLGDPIDGTLALHALGDSIHGLLEIGFLEAGGGKVQSHYQLCPVGESWVACDFQQRQSRNGDDYVMGIGPSSMLLASLTPRTAQGRALELACGIGWLSGQLSQAGMSVIASDLNPRALNLARFSARLNGIHGIDFRQGDGFSSVAGERFDLIVANPPYVQSPGGSMIYREGGPGDPILARLLRDLPGHLAPAGVAVVLINWTHQDDDDWSEAPLSWVTPEGTRRWLFQTDCSSPADYAWKWIGADPRFKGEAAATREMNRWLTYYRDAGIRRVSGGFIIVEKCETGTEWTREESRALDKIAPTAGLEVQRVLRNHTWLANAPDLLETIYQIPDGIRAEAGMILSGSGWERQTIRLTSPGRLSYDGQIDENILRLLAIVREGRPPSALVAEIRTRPEFAAIPDLADRIAALVRELVHHGMIVPSHE